MQQALEDPRLLDAADVRAQIAGGVPELDLIVTLEREPAMREFRGWDDGPKAARHRVAVTTLQFGVLDTLSAAEFQGRVFLENVPVFAGRASLGGLVKLLADPRVASVELNRTVQAQTAQGIALMNASVPRSVFTGSRLSIAIVDSGIDYNHAALGGGGFPNAKVIGGWDFGDNDADPLDETGHGTSVAGIAAGDVVPSGDYVGGVAPGARLYALKVSSGAAGLADAADIMAAWDWCVTHKNDDPAHPILVANTSYGGGMSTSPCSGGGYEVSAAALKSAGIANFAAAGNDGYCAAIAYPACYSDVISVGAVYDTLLAESPAWCISTGSCIGTTSTGCTSGWKCSDSFVIPGDVTCFSNSASFLDLLAPSYAAHVPQLGGGHWNFGGTSAASPYASGGAALLLDAALAANLSLSPDDLLNRLVSTGNYTLDPKSGIAKPRVNVGSAFTTLGTWVDFAYVGTETGSVSQPFNTLAEGVSAAPAGGTILVKSGTTLATPTTIAKHVSLRPWGGVVRVGP